MHWLKTHVGISSESPVTELSAADKLEEFRKEQDGYLFFSILDNGLGMEMDAIEEKNRELQDCGLQEKEKTAIGLANVNRRIRAVYGENCGISLKKNSIQGLEIIVKVQMEKDEQ